MSKENRVDKLPEVSDLLTSPEEAVALINERRRDPELFKKVSDYLNGDVPEHFIADTPITYLSRHVATPNFETLRFLELAQNLPFPIIIGEDLQDKFVSNNELKKCLGKLSVTLGRDKNNDEIFKSFTILDFNQWTGHPMNEVKLLNGQLMVEFHKELLSDYVGPNVKVVDESEWVSRQHKTGRTDLLSYYKNILSLLIVHGVMFEFYAEEDVDFVQDIFRKAFEEIALHFGHKPLVCEILTPEMEFERNWLAYPSEKLNKIEKVTS